MIVLDASAVVELLLNTPRATRLVARLAGPLETLHAPHLLDLEVASVLRRYEARGLLSSSDATRTLADLISLDITRYPHDAVLSRVWELRKNLSMYDAAYVALAEQLAAPLATYDARLAAAPGNTATIELFA